MNPPKKEHAVLVIGQTSAHIKDALRAVFNTARVVIHVAPRGIASHYLAVVQMPGSHLSEAVLQGIRHFHFKQVGSKAQLLENGEAICQFDECISQTAEANWSTREDAQLFRGWVIEPVKLTAKQAVRQQKIATAKQRARSRNNLQLYQAQQATA